ncbi:MAG: 30S ribosomal protein S16 [bacterium]
MAVSMRLRRTGKKKQAYFRVVVADSRSPRDGRFIEILGNYDPTQNPAKIEIDEERALHWLKSGAQPSDTVRSLLSKQGILARLAEEEPGHAVLERVQPGKTPKKTREAEARKRAAAEAEAQAKAEEEAAAAGSGEKAEAEETAEETAEEEKPEE